jgi:hypothetical protein
MKTDREKLMELAICAKVDWMYDYEETEKSFCEYIVDYFISKGVTIPVRCGECKYWQDNNGGYPHTECRWGKDETPDADDFCSYGERKEDGN